MFSKKSVLFVILIACSNSVFGAGKPLSKQTENDRYSMSTMLNAARSVEQQSKELRPPTIWQRFRHTVEEKSLLFLVRHPNNVTDTLIARELMISTGNGKLQFKGQQHVNNKYPELDSAFRRIMAQQLIKTVATAHPNLPIRHSQALLIALENATAEDAQLLTPVAVRNFTNYMEGRFNAGQNEAQVLVLLMERNPAITKEFYKIMAAHPTKLLSIIDCSNFSPFFTTFAKQNPEMLVALAKEYGKNGWPTWQLRDLKKFMTPEQIKAAGLQEAAQPQPAQAAAASVIRSWVSS